MEIFCPTKDFFFPSSLSDEISHYFKVAFRNGTPQGCKFMHIFYTFFSMEVYHYIQAALVSRVNKGTVYSIFRNLSVVEELFHCLNVALVSRGIKGGIYSIFVNFYFFEEPEEALLCLLLVFLPYALVILICSDSDYVYYTSLLHVQR